MPDTPAITGPPKPLTVSNCLSQPLRDAHCIGQSFERGTPSGNALAAAVQWIEGLLCRNAGTSLAVIAVAWFGFEMLNGRLSLRCGGLLALGCFVFFGAPSIEGALMDLSYAS